MTQNLNLVECVDNGKGRCATHDGHSIAKDGMCQTGRRIKANSAVCPVCHEMFSAKAGRVLASTEQEDDMFSIHNQLIAQVGDGAVCPDCAKFYDKELGKGTFIKPVPVIAVPKLTPWPKVADVATEQIADPIIEPAKTVEPKAKKPAKPVVKKTDPVAFAKAVLDGSHYRKHRKEELFSGTTINYCDCGCGSTGSAEEMMGVLNPVGNGAWCLSQACFRKAKAELGDRLPVMTFREALNSAWRKQKELTRRHAPAREPEHSQGEDISDVVPSTPAPRAPFVSTQKKLDTVKAVYDALMATPRDSRVRFGRKDEDTGLTGCTVRATKSSLCHGQPSDWAEMGSVIVGDMAFGFCPVCTAELARSEVILPMTHKKAMLQVLGLPEFPAREERPVRPTSTRPRSTWVNPMDQFGFDTGKGGGKGQSNARKRQLQASRAEREKLLKQATKAFQAEVRRLGDEVARKMSELEVVNGLREQAEEAIASKKSELAEARATKEPDEVTIGVLELELGDLERDLREATDMVANHAEALSEAEREQQTLIDAGPEALVERPASKKDKRNGGSKAA